jgi:hypothetical protein
VKRKEKEKEGKAERGGAGWFRFVAGLDWVPGTAQVGLLASSFFCAVSFLIFCFLISFITFAFVTQMTSNQFVKFSKIPSNIPEQ